MEPEVSLPQSQAAATCPYPEPVQSSPYPHISLPEDHQISCSFFVAQVLPKYQSGSEAFSLFRNTIRFFGELLAPRPTPKLEDHPLSTVRDCLFNISAATLHTGCRFSIRHLRTRHAVVIGSHLSRCYTHTVCILYIFYYVHITMKSALVWTTQNQHL